MVKAPDIARGDENFWDWNPEYINVFEDFYKKDKSKGKIKSSNTMWALYHKLNPQSVFYSIANKDEIIKKKFLTPNFEWKTISEIESLFKSTILTQAERSLVEWDETMQKRDRWLRTQEYDMENAKDLDSILANTAKLYQLYAKVKKEFEAEKVKKGRGNKPLSATDANRI